MALAGCASTQQTQSPTANAKAHYKIGAAYKIGGRWYRPKEDAGYNKKGVASWYGDAFHGKPTANGEIFDQHRLSAAHTTLPLPSLVEVENLENGRRLIVRVNDRGPFVDNRLIDLSRAAAEALGFLEHGLARVRVKNLGYADLTAKAPAGGASRSAKPVRVAGDVPQTGTPHRQPPTIKPARDEDHAAGSGDDVIGRLIMEHAVPGTPSVAPIGPTASISETPAANNAAPLAAALFYWVEIETYYDLDTLEKAQISLQDAGPLAVFSKENDGISIHTLRMGPYGDPGVAKAHAANAVRAGFANARLVDASL